MKVQRLITVDSELNQKLKTEDNASGLIESLLRQHYDLVVLKHHIPDIGELDKKAEELNLKLEELQQRKREALTFDEKIRKLDKLGITNKFLIERLKNLKNKDSMNAFKQFKEDYNIPEILSLFKAWDIIHNESE